MTHLDAMPDHFRRALDDYVRRAAADKRARIGAPDSVRSEPWTCTYCGRTTEPLPPVLGVQLSVPPRCDCIAAEEEKARERWYAEELPRLQWYRWVQGAGVPPRYLDATFGTFERRKGAVQALEACEGYAAGFEPGRTSDGLVLFGPWGAGKTHLAVATARHIHDRAFANVHFTTAAELVARTRGFHDEAARKAKSADLLVLDDVGQVTLPEWGRDVLYDVLNARYERGLPVVLTTNLDADGLRSHLGAAAVSRLTESCDWVPVTASDYRAEIARRKAA